MEIMQPLFIISEKLAGYPDLVADAAFTLISDVAFDRKCGEASGFFIKFTETAEPIKYVHGVVKYQGVISDIQMAVVIDPWVLNRFLPARYGRL
jgi:hypothetical protein